MFDKLSMKSFVIGIGAIVLALVALIGGLGQWGISAESESAERMGAGKDVVADILPPPLYLVEAQLKAHELARAPQREAAAMASELKRLHADYETRNQYC